MSTRVSKNVSAPEVRILRDADIFTDVVAATTASFVDSGSVLDARFAASIALTVLNTGGANGLSYQVLGSVDGVTYVVVQGSANVAFGANASYSASPAAFGYYKIQVKDQSGGSHTAASVSGIAK